MSLPLKTNLIVLLMLVCPSTLGAQQNPDGMAVRGTGVVEDIAILPVPSAVKLKGFLGNRYSKNEINRLLNVDETELLAGFRNRPGKQAWIGEHAGKFLHAASLTYANTGNAELRAKMDRVAMGLIQTQEPDGYLGTYVKGKRFGLFENANWDVWVHKYDLLGLLAYYQYTGNRAALEACQRIGDLLVKTFGPNRKSIISAGTHVGMASCSVLEPMVLLYRATKDLRYLEFGRYIVNAYEEQNGPNVVTSLITSKSVHKTANAKAYEMTSNLVGLCELYRVTGEKRLLQAALNGWTDIATHRLYITGSGSSFEVWQDENHFPNGNNANICETCVTVTWEQLNIQLFRLTGECRFIDQLEKSVYNHLLAAQRPDGSQWCYYTPLEGIKPYGNSTNCCLSSGPRGVSMLPTFGVTYENKTKRICINLYNACSENIAFGPEKVRVDVAGEYPFVTESTIHLKLNSEAQFGLALRVPAWADSMNLWVNKKRVNEPYEKSQYLVLNRSWRDGDEVKVQFPIKAKILSGDHENAGKAALLWGPVVFGIDSANLPTGWTPARTSIDMQSKTTSKSVLYNNVSGEVTLPVSCEYRSNSKTEKRLVDFVPFCNAGADGGRFQIWVRRSDSAMDPNGNVFEFATEFRSRMGNVSGDLKGSSLVVTFDARKRELDWYGYESDEPVSFNRVTFVHGRSFHDGGWFDTSGVKPTIEIRTTKGGPWQPIGLIKSYPQTSATENGGLKDGQTFVFNLPTVTAYGIRISGKPASGDNSNQSFSSCGGLIVQFIKNSTSIKKN